VDPIKVLIVEDERLAADAVRKLLERDSEIEIVGWARDGATAVELIRSLKPNLVLLDIQIPELDGFGVIAEVGVDNMPVVVFVTAYDRYCLQAFEVHAIDYLLKPFEEDRFGAALARAKKELQTQERLARRVTSLITEMTSPARRRLPIKSGGRIIFIDVESIDYLEAAGNYVLLHVGEEQYRTRETLNALEERLFKADFVRIHRSAIVNRRRIRELKPWFTGEYAIVMATGKELTLTRAYRDRLPLLLVAD